ncbi:MAG TPA: hypothetical protein VF342_02225 [Alphaproteobacteria bacterium]
MTASTTDQRTARDADQARREFLKRCGKFAVVTPPAVSFLLSTTLDSPAAAASGGIGRGGGGGGDSCDLFCQIGRALGLNG